MKNSSTLKNLQEENLTAEEVAYLNRFSVKCSVCGTKTAGVPESFNKDYYRPHETAPTCPRCDNVHCLEIVEKPTELPSMRVYMKYPSVRLLYPVPEFASVFSTQGL